MRRSFFVPALRPAHIRGLGALPSPNRALAPAPRSAAKWVSVREREQGDALCPRPAPVNLPESPRPAASPPRTG